MIQSHCVTIFMFLFQIWIPTQMYSLKLKCVYFDQIELHELTFERDFFINSCDNSLTRLKIDLFTLQLIYNRSTGCFRKTVPSKCSTELKLFYQNHCKLFSELWTAQ